MNNASLQAKSLFLSIEERESTSSRVAEPTLLRRAFNDGQPFVYLVAAPQFKQYQDRNTCQQYNLTKIEFDEFSRFFKEHSDGQFIEASFVKTLMLAVIKSKNMVVANKNDVERALNCFGTFLTFEEFLNFMSLFFASELNLANRIQCYLMTISDSSQNEDFLLAYEAFQRFKFLKKFYGINKRHVKLVISNERISIYDFIKLVTPCLKPKCFVKWK